MKRFFCFIPVFLILCASLAVADVSGKKLDDGTVEVTFFYANPRATEVLLAGDFNNWQDGAWPMEKGDTGFTLTRVFKMTDELRYKFISDGSWTTDMRAPDFVDDGFGGKNSHVVVADLVSGGEEEGGASKAKINFVSWTMLGVQAKYLTQGAADPASKGMDLDEVTVGFKSYNKFTGQFLPSCPFYIEIALSETDLEDYTGENEVRRVYQSDRYGNDTISWEDGLKDLVNGVFADPVAYLARANDNSADDDGPGSNPFLGHLKFGFDTPWIKYYTGFNYAKPDVRQAVTWKTIDGNWDAGYQHVGGFNVFSLGDKPQVALEELTGVKFDIGFAPNKTADRKGKKYGYWGWLDAVIDDNVTVDFQTNGAYDSDGLFYDPVEHDFILGAKGAFDAGGGKISVALQGLVATHQKSTAELLADGASTVANWSGYSTDVWYRSGDFDGIENLAGNVRVGYKADLFDLNLEYRFRGAQASMLYLRENHDDGTFDLSENLGVLNSQRIAFDGALNLLDGALGIGLGVQAEMPLSELTAGDETYDGWMSEYDKISWYGSRRFIEEMEPIFNRTGGTELTFLPSVSYSITDAITVGLYADLNLCAYTWSDGIDEDEANKYASSDSAFRLKVAGASFRMKPDSDIIKDVNVLYGLDLQNQERMFNTLVGQVTFPADITATLALGLKSENVNAESFDSDANNPFAFAVGFAKKFQALKKPVLYAQFVFNMDPFKHFGDGQDAINVNRSNVNGSWEKEGVGKIDPVDWYDGEAAVRVGIRWDI